MKKKIFDALKTKYKTFGFGDSAFNGVAEYLEKTVTEDAQIETAIDGVESLLKSFQGDADKLRTENANYKKQIEASKKKEETVETSKTESETTSNPEMKAVLTALETLTKEVSGIKQGNVAQSRKQIFEQSLKDVPEKLKANKLKDFERMQFEDEDAFNNYVTETVSDLKDFVQTNNEQQLGASGSPLIPGGGKIGDNEVSPMMKAFITNRAKTTEASQPAKAV